MLLKFRPRSEKEIADKLRRKKFDAAVIGATLDFLREKSFVDDARFAMAWTDSRLKRPLGLRRISRELSAKGIDKGLIESAMQKAREDYNESRIVGKIARDRLARLKGIDPQKAKRRVFAYLLRRGFTPETIIDSMEQL